jgi:predicted PurR-regulated permease PerM
LLLLVMGALLAFVLSPLVDFIGRRLPRWSAITIVYLVALALLGGVGYIVVSTAVAQLTALAQDLPGLLTTSGAHPSPIVGLLHSFGITTAQLGAARKQLLDWAEGAAGTVAGKAVPIVTGVAGALLDLVLIVVISVYFVIDGPRLVAWLRNRMPISQRSRIVFALEILDRTVGGYVRGELLLASLIGVLVGAGMFFFGLPFALLLGMLAFFLEFIPILGVFVYFIFVHVIEGDVVGPRIIGRVLGLHPVAAILALIVGADLFGIWGALFASPVAGIIQAVVVALWSEWREGHPDDFPAAAPAAATGAATRAMPAASRADADKTSRWGARWSRLLGRGAPTQGGTSRADLPKAGPALSDPISAPAAHGGRPDASPDSDDANEPREALRPGRGHP